MWETLLHPQALCYDSLFVTLLACFKWSEQGYQAPQQSTSLGSTDVTPRLLQWAKNHPIKNIVVSDTAAEQGSWAFAKAVGHL